MKKLLIFSLSFLMSFHSMYTMERGSVLSLEESKLFYKLQTSIMKSDVPTVRTLLSLGVDSVKTPGRYDISCFALAKSIKEAKRDSSAASEIYDLLLSRTTLAEPVIYASGAIPVIADDNYDFNIPTADVEFANENIRK